MILSAMFYLSLFSPILLSIFRYKVPTFVTLVVLVFLGSFIAVVPKIFFDLPVTPQEISSTTSTAQAKQSFIHYHFATDQLIIPFTFGTVIGYLLKAKPKINLGTRFAQYIIWIGMLLMPFLATEWNEQFKPLEGHFSQFNFISWFILSKIMWSGGFAWVIFACATGRGCKLYVQIFKNNIFYEHPICYYSWSTLWSTFPANSTAIKQTGIWRLPKSFHYYQLSATYQSGDGAVDTFGNRKYSAICQQFGEIIQIKTG